MVLRPRGNRRDGLDGLRVLPDETDSHETGTDLVRVGVSTVSDVDPDDLASIHDEFADVYAEAQAMSAADAIAVALAGPGPS